MISRKEINCWRRTKARRVSFLIDGAEYFEAFVSAVRQARRTIYIAGWDIDSRLRLIRRDGMKEGAPPLGDFLNQAAVSNASLEIYILIWDFPMAYLRERQWMPEVHLGWKTHRRVHFHLDGEHPIGASHHEKYVVIDDSLAFCGGMDLTKNRWDTSQHGIDDARRKDPAGNGYAPFHDVQIAVDGEAAQALGERFRERWRHATGDVLSAVKEGTVAGWPRGIEAHIDSGCPVSISRTFPPYKDLRSIREVERVYIDAIHSAKSHIYIENQYLTAGGICRALGQRLAGIDPPEVIVVMPREASGWLEQSTMDAIRTRRLAALASQDQNKRLSVYYPVASDGKTPVYIHAKLMVVDDRLVIVGSANLSNRSMGMDSECCLTLEGGGSDVEAAITQFRRRLMAEHLGTEADKLAGVEKVEGSLQAAVLALQQSGRSLKSLDGNNGPLVDGTELMPDETYLDPDEPFMLERMIDHFAREPQSKRGLKGQIVKTAVILLFLLAMTVIWRWTPLSEVLTSENLAQWAGMMGHMPLMIPIIIVGFVLGGVIFVPITLMVGATALILPPWQGFLCAMTGMIFNAWMTYLIGRWLGKGTVQRLAGKRLERLNRYLARKGILTMALVRNVPVAPFTVVNMVAGTTGIKMKHYLAGTAIGMMPGILAITLFTDRIMAAVQNPNLINITIAAAVIGLVGLAFWWMKKRLKDRVR